MLYKRLLTLQQARDEAAARRAAAADTMQHVEPVAEAAAGGAVGPVAKKASRSSRAAVVNKASLQGDMAAGVAATAMTATYKAAVGDVLLVGMRKAGACQGGNQASHLMLNPTATAADGSSQAASAASHLVGSSDKRPASYEESIEAEGSAEMGRILSHQLRSTRKVRVLM